MLSIFATSEKQSLFIWQTIRAFPALPYIISVAGTAFLYFCDFNMFSLVLSHDLSSPVCNHLTTPLFLLTPCSLMLYNGMLTACINARLHLELIKKRKLSHVIRKKKGNQKRKPFFFLICGKLRNSYLLCRNCPFTGKVGFDKMIHHPPSSQRKDSCMQICWGCKLFSYVFYLHKTVTLRHCWIHRNACLLSCVFSAEIFVALHFYESWSLRENKLIVWLTSASCQQLLWCFQLSTQLVSHHTGCIKSCIHWNDQHVKCPMRMGPASYMRVNEGLTF